MARVSNETLAKTLSNTIFDLQQELKKDKYFDISKLPPGLSRNFISQDKENKANKRKRQDDQKKGLTGISSRKKKTQHGGKA